MYNNTIARARKDSQGQRRNCRMSAASQAPHIPRAMRIAERDAEYRQHQSPNRGSQTAQPASSDWHESKNMREGPPSSKESKSPRCNGQHSGCRRRRPMLPYMLPLRQPSLLLLLGWPPVRLVQHTSNDLFFSPQSAARGIAGKTTRGHACCVQLRVHAKPRTVRRTTAVAADQRRLRARQEVSAWVDTTPWCVR